MNATDRLVELAREEFEFGISLGGDAFLASRSASHVCWLLSARGLRSFLANTYYRRHGSAPSGSVLTDALAVLEGGAATQEAEKLYLRVAQHGGSVWIDLGRSDNKLVEVNATGWRVRSQAPVRFLRTNLTGPMPEPRQGDAAALGRFLNLAPEDLELMLGVLVSAFIPDGPHPVTVFRGPQGVGKSFAAKVCMQVVDASPAPTRTAPRSFRDLAVTFAASRATCFDNLSHIPAWLSDVLCKAVTGDAFVRRVLYTDRDVAVDSWRRVIFINGIDIGPLRGDLASRAVSIDLRPLGGRDRRIEAELDAAFEEAWPSILGGILTLVSSVLGHRDAVTLEQDIRMIDFARILAVVDLERQGDALGRYLEAQNRELAGTAMNDPLCAAVAALMEDREEWVGTATELLRQLATTSARLLPKSPSALSQSLNRAAPLLETIGILVKTRLHDTAGNRQIRIWRSDAPSSEASAAQEL